ncbi:MAG: hypothetical protein MK160_12345 [Rhodobacteraceae bacterium]|nr:hypothetical protein [Paracoccaceae bacterium]
MRGIRVGCDRHLTAHITLYSQSFHATFHCTPGHVTDVYSQFMPDVSYAMSLAAIIKGILDLLTITCVFLGAV